MAARNEIFRLLGKIAVDNSEANKKIDDTTSKAEKSEGKFNKVFTKIGEYVKKAFQTKEPEAFGQSLDDLSDTIASQENDLKGLKDKYKDLYLTHGKNSEEAKACAKEIEDLSKSLKENKDKLKEADEAADSFDETIEDVGETTEKSESRMSGAFKKIGAAVIAAFSVAAILSFSKSLVDLAATAESAFAKVTTLLENGTDLDAYYEQIRQASSATGVSMADFSEATYQAISASVDQAEAVDFTTQAVKLAKAGFTETATAVDVLTTTLNAYGDKAGTAEEISNKLIMTQNLGKTTVDELASSMGKIIPTANMYGVSLDTLTGAYAEMTKNGIATAEATTYMNGMLNELGSSGTTASKLIQEKLGMSFTEAMESGHSLTEILNLLQEEADATGVSLGDMFGSQEAVKAAATLQANAADLDSIIAQMGDSAGATETAYKKVTDTFAARSEKLKVQFQNVGIVLGNAILPILIKVTDYIEEKMPQIEELIGQLSPILEGMFDSLFPSLMQLVESVFPIAIELLSTITPLLSNIASTVLPEVVRVVNMILPVILQLVSAALPRILEILMPILDLIDPILDLLEPVMDLLVALIDPIMMLIEAALPPLVDLLTNIISEHLPYLQDIIQWLCDFLTEYVIPLIEFLIDAVIGPALQFISLFTSETMNGIMQTISGALKVITGIIDFVLKLVEGDFSGAGEALKRILSGISDFFIGTLRTLFANILAGLQQNATNIMSVIETAKTWLHDKIAGIKESVLGHFDNIKSGIFERMTGAVDTVKTLIDKMKGFFDFEFKIPNIPKPHMSVKPAGWKIGDLLQGTKPDFDIEWYAKAMDSGMIMDKPTIFGISGNTLMAGGEAGSETVVGTQSLLQMIDQAVAGAGGHTEELLNIIIGLLGQIIDLIKTGSGNIIIPVYFSGRRIGEVVVEGQKIADYRSGGR